VKISPQALFEIESKEYFLLFDALYCTKFISIHTPVLCYVLNCVYLWFCILSGYDDVFSFGANVFASKAYQHSGSRNTAGV